MAAPHEEHEEHQEAEDKSAPSAAEAPPAPEVIGRYVIYEAFARGGMATVHFARSLALGGFSRIVAVKRHHREIASDAEVVATVTDEARLASRIAHSNVLGMLDIVQSERELLLVTEYIDGESLAKLAEAARVGGEPIPLPIAAAILCDTLRGLHAAHLATDEHSAPLHIVHRDVSPQNILVGSDGIARVLDFGIATARVRAQRTQTGQIKGKLHYLAPEQVHGNATLRTDIFATGVVAWELVTGERLFSAKDDASLLAAVLSSPILNPNARGANVPEALAKAILQSLARDPSRRFSSAQAMALAIEESVGLATAFEVGVWVERWGGAALESRRARVAAIEASVPSDSSSRVVRRRPRRRGVVVATAGAGAAVLLLGVAMHRFALSHDATSATPVAAGTSGPASLEPPPPSAPSATQHVLQDSLSPRPSLPQRPARAACVPPFVFDAQGRKRFKPQCF